LANKLLVLIGGRTAYTPLSSGVEWDEQNPLLADIDRIDNEVFADGDPVHDAWSYTRARRFLSKMHNMTIQKPRSY